MKKIIATSGYWNPLHAGYVRLLEEAKKRGDFLVVIVNNDTQVALKGSVPFMDQKERLEIVRAIGCVDFALIAGDQDRTVINTLKVLRPHVFAKGGDSTPDNVPELGTCNQMGTEIIFGVGGDKIQSSSWLKSKAGHRNE